MDKEGEEKKREEGVELHYEMFINLDFLVGQRFGRPALKR
jgi:hypothetical protein